MQISYHKLIKNDCTLKTPCTSRKYHILLRSKIQFENVGRKFFFFRFRLFDHDSLFRLSLLVVSLFLVFRLGRLAFAATALLGALFVALLALVFPFLS